MLAFIPAMMWNANEVCKAVRTASRATSATPHNKSAFLFISRSSECEAIETKMWLFSDSLALRDRVGTNFFRQLGDRKQFWVDHVNSSCSSTFYNFEFSPDRRIAWYSIRLLALRTRSRSTLPAEVKFIVTNCEQQIVKSLVGSSINKMEPLWPGHGMAIERRT